MTFISPILYPRVRFVIFWLINGYSFIHDATDASGPISPYPAGRSAMSTQQQLWSTRPDQVSRGRYGILEFNVPLDTV